MSETPTGPPSLLATDRKQFLQIIPIPALDGFHLVRLPSRGSRPRASGADPAASSTASHLTSETLRLETETSHKWDRRCHAAVFFRGTNLTGHLCFWKHGTLGPPPTECCHTASGERGRVGRRSLLTPGGCLLLRDKLPIDSAGECDCSLAS